MNTAIRSPLLTLAPADRPEPAPVKPAKFSALDWVLADQQTLTAVDRFSRKHDHGTLLAPGPGPGPAGAPRPGSESRRKKPDTYRDLIPGKTRAPASSMRSRSIWICVPAARPA